MSERGPFGDIRGAPVDTDDRLTPRLGPIDWRVGALLVVLAYVLVLAWVNAGTTVTVQLPPFLDAEVGLVWLVLVTLLLGGAVTLVVQAGYRGYRRQREALEKSARADLATGSKPGAGEEG